MDHYKVDSEHPWIDLVFRLTNDWIPGFIVVETPPKTRGAPNINERASQKRLVEEIDHIKSLTAGMSLKAACGKFLKAHGHEKRWSDINDRTVENLYRLAKNLQKREQKTGAELMGRLLSDPTTIQTLHGLFGLEAPKPEKMAPRE